MVTKRDIERTTARVRAATTPFEVLGATVASTPAELQALRRLSASHLHPDRSHLADAHDLCATVNVAYDVLTDLKRRKELLSSKAVKQAVCQPCKGTGRAKVQKGFATRVGTCPVCNGKGQL